MKTNLLKMALAALALLPIGAWAEDVISQTTLWTFDQFQNNDNVAKTAVFNYHGLYITGHAEDKPSQAKSGGVSTPTALNGDIKFVSISNLYAQGAQNTELKNNRTASTATQDAVAFKTGVAGTVYVYIKGTTKSNETRYVNIYEADPAAENSGSSSAAKYQTATTGAVQLVTQAVDANKNIFIGVSAGSYNLYAVKFVPTSETPTEKVIKMSDMGLMTFADTHAWTLPEGLKAYATRSGVTDGKLTLKEITGAIPACMAVILQGEHSKEYTLTSTDVSCFNFNTTETPRYIDANYSFRPVLADYVLPQTYSSGSDDNQNWDNYILAKGADGKPVFAKPNGTGTLAAGKAYYCIRRDQAKVSGGSAPSFFSLDFGENSTTGISQTVSNGDAQPVDIYNLAGQRVAKPSKGLYIVNGKKVIMK